VSGPATAPIAAPAERFLVRTAITEADFRVYARTYIENMPSMQRMRRRLLLAAVWMSFVCVLCAVFLLPSSVRIFNRSVAAAGSGAGPAITSLVISAVFLILTLIPLAATFWAWRRYFRGMTPIALTGMLRDARLRGMFEPATLVAEPRGVFVQRPQLASRIDWSLFESLVDRDGVIMLISRGTPLTITPRAAFRTAAEADAFVAACRRWMETAPAGLTADPAGFVAARDVLCPTCGYNLRGGDGVMCPECGTPLTAAALVWGARSER
jgi:hypothetical protein